MTADDYIDRVLAFLPQATPMRAQIALELRGHIAERLAHGQPVDAVLSQLGDPARLAESYLSAVPLEPAPLRARIWAKLVDIALIMAAVAIPAIPAGLLVPDAARPFVVVAALTTGYLGFVLYTILAEHLTGQTVGKRLARLQVVRESGAPIGLGQAIVRQLPIGLQIFLIDGLFALVTDRRQRAFELLSKTRVVRATTGSEPPVRA